VEGKRVHRDVPEGVSSAFHFPYIYSQLLSQADNCVIRITNAAEPSKGGLLGPTTYNPNMAIKCYRDAPENPNSAPPPQLSLSVMAMVW
jgi:hypothetical protein